MALVALLAALAGLPAEGADERRTTGDEPHYLVTALALAAGDGLDVRRQYADETYRPFHAATLEPQAAPGPGGRLVEPHGPLLPALLAVPAALGGWAAAKTVMALIAAGVAALTLVLAVRRLGAPPGPAAAVVAVFAASMPLAPYGVQIFPEAPAALAVLAGVHGASGAVGRRGVLVTSVAVIALPWLAVKYVPVAAAIAVVALWRCARAGRRRTALTTAAVFGVAGIAFAVLHRHWYGGWTPYAAGVDAANGESAIGSDPDLLGRAARLSGLLIDDRFGIMAWQPAWVLAVPALGVFLARRPPGWAVVVAPLAVGWLVATFLALTMQGWWVPGRQIVVVLPLAVAVTAWWASAGRRPLIATLSLGALGVVSHLVVAVEGVTGRIGWVSDLGGTGDPIHRSLTAILPDYLAPDTTTWPLHVLWSLALACLLIGAWWRARIAVRASPADRGDVVGPDAHGARSR